MYAYLYGKTSVLGLDLLGESQLVGYPELASLNLPPQFPSVASESIEPAGRWRAPGYCHRRLTLKHWYIISR